MEKFECLFRNRSIEQSLTVAIFDSSAQGIRVPMDKRKYDKLYESINNAIFSDISGDELVDLPTFGENKHFRGVMKVECSDAEAKSWLEDIIERTKPLWQDMHLKVVDFDELPQQNRVLGRFPKCKLSIEQIHHIISAMNLQLNVDCWTILSSKITENDVHVNFLIDNSQLDMLRARNFKLNFGVGCAIFKDVSMKQEKPRQVDTTETDAEARTTIQIPD